jgi:hypothetical protein
MRYDITVPTNQRLAVYFSCSEALMGMLLNARRHGSAPSLKSTIDRTRGILETHGKPPIF